ncbi:MAG: ADP-forming succinate--CoA ligase subunit beta [Elusimicrobia bacterium]|nr:ADP-forming succinate--CoA ligase subunit beta [Elusimicrobiota bacterium]MDE2237193.1 ADP-forming succinate--CoA ligase subunit beta [Elusimicrobiota bacterium]MDE2426147.1 ADP-forming succinate--CoA ligase subunit beta [Elusimicrobiota bacterium]
MKLLEHQSKELFRAKGVAVPPSGGAIEDLGRLAAALKRAGRGPWVLKAQVLAGGRGKAGGVKLARTPREARELARQILGMTLISPQTGPQGVKVASLLVEGGAKIERELYLSIVLDRKAACPVVIASAQGGMEIETLAHERPEAIVRVPVDPDQGLLDYQGRRLGYALDIPAERMREFVALAKALCRVFLDYDCSLVEVNPLVLTPKGLLALDGKVIVDDNALFRQKALAALPDLESSRLEREAKRHGISYIGLDGNIGCMVNGAGLAMGTMDTIALAGGTPANFLDVGGAADQQRVTKAFQILLKDRKVKAVLVNIFGGIVRCDMIAAGVIAAVRKVKLKIPLVVRLQGTNVDKGRALLKESGIRLTTAEDLWEAAQKAVAAAKTAAEA